MSAEKAIAYSSENMDKYWAGGHGRYNSYILTALLATVPTFERFLCRAMSELIRQYPSESEMVNYARQLKIEESEHIRVHDDLFESLHHLGYPVSDIAADTQAWIDTVEKKPLTTRMAYVALSEYNIANACKCILKGHPMYEGGYRPWLDYQLQHAEEEAEHYVLSLAIARSLNIGFFEFFLAYLKYSIKGTQSFISAIKHIHKRENCRFKDRAKFWLYWYKTQYISRNPVFLKVTLNSINILYEVFVKKGIEGAAKRHMSKHADSQFMPEYH